MSTFAGGGPRRIGRGAASLRLRSSWKAQAPDGPACKTNERETPGSLQNPGRTMVSWRRTRTFRAVVDSSSKLVRLQLIGLSGESDALGYSVVGSGSVGRLRGVTTAFDQEMAGCTRDEASLAAADPKHWWFRGVFELFRERRSAAGRSAARFNGSVEMPAMRDDEGPEIDIGPVDDARATLFRLGIDSQVRLWGGTGHPVQ